MRKLGYGMLAALLVLAQALTGCATGKGALSMEQESAATVQELADESQKPAEAELAKPAEPAADAAAWANWSAAYKAALAQYRAADAKVALEVRKAIDAVAAVAQNALSPEAKQDVVWQLCPMAVAAGDPMQIERWGCLDGAMAMAAKEKTR